ncbi:putative ABC transport system permease protein [Paenibacillus cellulosilyticus]|uniref:Putative ABC transport system permease protein n=1 Tax=Paenibacillus cellulosilyticus TaxID=375489 RepID=A0A2V2YUA9_9BACL|nr:ABC transporter permease [Paenibacillus cellulosilyticus]PWW03281.1 putative ABC transport system permease protein [Paenibacillus cellulosilyticus]QKS43759.1 ABC transporter permease [Paenibacillus cellulosilyticus]
MSILNLIKANLRKGKGTVVSLILLIAAASLLLNVGLTIISSMSSFYEHKVEELSDPHVVMMMEQSDYKQENGDFFRNYDGVTATEVESILVMPSATMRFGDSDLNTALSLLDADTDRKLGPLKLIEKLDSVPDNEAIYLPYSYNRSGGYKLGDSITIAYQDKPYSYKVAGFFESTMLGTNNMGLIKMFLSGAAYEALSAKLGGDARGILISAAMQDMTRSTRILDDYHKVYPLVSEGATAKFHYMADIESMKQVNGLTVNMIAMILVAFAVVIVLAALLVIRFRVSNMIKDSVVNIGVLKALGYTNRQITSSHVGQFLLLSLLAGVIGVELSYLFFPQFGNILSTLTGLLWEQREAVVLNLISILFVMISVTLVALFTSLRVRKLHPVTALRGGLKTHSFKRNYFSLEKARGGLQLLHAGKSIMINSKQNLMITLIMIAVTFASVFSLALYDNIARDKTAFIHLVGAETSNVAVQAKSEAISGKLKAAIDGMDGVQRTAMMDTITTMVDGQSIFAYVSDDFAKLDNQMVYEGRFPKFDNEIAISWAVSKLIDKGIGDTVDVETGGAKHTYLVTGMSQSISNMGQAVYLTASGVQHLIPNYKGLLIQVYLDGMTNTQFITDVKAKYGAMASEVTDVDATIDSQSSIYSTAVAAVMGIVLVITVVVIVLILFMVVRTALLKRRRDFGIMKATGYTTSQLMNQLTFSYMPIMLVGVMIGGALGALCTNGILTVLLSSSGIHNVQFTIKLPMITALCIALVVLAYAVSMTAAYRMKHITPHGLITE